MQRTEVTPLGVVGLKKGLRLGLPQGHPASPAAVRQTDSLTNASAQYMEDATNQLRNRGFALMHLDSDRDILDIARTLGRVRADPRMGTDIRVLRPQPTADAPPNTLSSRYGSGPFPLHTEAAYLHKPPRYLLLFCRDPGSGDRPTLLMDGLPLRELALNQNRTPIWVVRSGRRPFLTQAISLANDTRILLRYDRECMFAQGKAAREEDEALQEFVATATPIEIQWEAGWLLIIDNARMFHGRCAAVHDDGARTMMRVLVEANDGMG